jgi:Mg-chelatase subunit ChlD
MEEKKGIELVKKDTPREVSVTVGNTTFQPQGSPAGVRFNQEAAYVYLIIDTSGSMRNGKLEQAKKGAWNLPVMHIKRHLVGLIGFSSEVTISAPQQRCQSA